MRLIIVSNRLPVVIENVDTFTVRRSIGGLATGLNAYTTRVEKGETIFDDYLWLGWPGHDVPEQLHERLRDEFVANHKFYPVFIPNEITTSYYSGFCNNTIWPLFHYFPNHTEHDCKTWYAYRRANELFLDALRMAIKPRDVVWIHDYHLMLLPQLVREEFPETKISFFLHVPFPASDILRHLEKDQYEGILQGILGADVVGFHTSGYREDFLQCLTRLLKKQYEQNLVEHNNRKVLLEVFPMGIDYQGIQTVVGSNESQAISSRLNDDFRSQKKILSVDRLDYTKGILNRLLAFEKLLNESKEWTGKIVLILIVAPSRRDIDSYREIKKSIDEAVGRINGTYSSTTWTPVIYQYRQVELPELCGFYSACDVALVTPYRDGMNLIAKEFVASHTDHKGVLILSENAGAICELTDSISVNPFSVDHLCQSIRISLAMSHTEQLERNSRMHDRLKSYDVLTWAGEIMTSLFRKPPGDVRSIAKPFDQKAEAELLDHFRKSTSRLFIFDYDGTLSPLIPFPRDARPSNEVLRALDNISQQEKTRIVIISGRDKKILEEWFNGYNVSLGADFGAWIRDGGGWQTLKHFNLGWKDVVRPLMSKYIDRLPGSFLEEKHCALVWDYRTCAQEIIIRTTDEFNNELLRSMQIDLGVDVLLGRNSLIVRNVDSNKGNAAARWLKNGMYDFILSAGDDDVDEELFKVLPLSAYTFGIGNEQTSARFHLPNQGSMYELLAKFMN